MTLGKTSTTGDLEGEFSVGMTDQPTAERIKTVLHQFTGVIQQTPPIYSAIKIDGQRAYKLARSGKAPLMQPRPVTIYDSKLRSYVYPEVMFTTTVSSGTFIRSLVEAMGQVLGTGAFTSALRRSVVGSFAVEDAMTLEELSSELLYKHIRQLPSQFRPPFDR